MRKRVVRTNAAQESAVLERMRQNFRDLCGLEAYDRRAAAIAALPQISYRGHVLHTIQCRGGFGRGAHALNVPERLLWALIDLRQFTCPYHR